MVQLLDEEVFVVCTDTTVKISKRLWPRPQTEIVQVLGCETGSILAGFSLLQDKLAWWFFCKLKRTGHSCYHCCGRASGTDANRSGTINLPADVYTWLGISWGFPLVNVGWVVVYSIRAMVTLTKSVDLRWRTDSLTFFFEEPEYVILFYCSVLGW